MPEFGPYRFWGKVDPTGRQKPTIVAEIDEPAVDGSTATLRLYDVIDSYGGYWGVSAKEFAAALDTVPATVTDLRLHINSPGGEVYEGVAILNALRRHPATVTAVVDGLAASAASFIATGVAANGGRVIMAPNTEMMIHDAWGIVIGPAEDMRFMAGRLDALSDNIASVYAEKAGGDVATWRAAMLAETWYSAQEAVDAGLADEVEGAAADDSEIIAARFDRGGFRHASRADAGPPKAPDADVAAGVAAALRRSKMASRRAAISARKALEQAAS